METGNVQEKAHVLAATYVLLIKGQSFDLVTRACDPLIRVPFVVFECVDDLCEVRALVQLFPGHNFGVLSSVDA